MSNKHRSRRCFFRLFLIVPILFIIGMGASIQSQLHQKALNQKLLSAILRNDTPAVLSLLVQGADANTQETVADTRSPWQYLLDFLHRKTVPQQAGKSALLVAFEIQERPDSSLPASEEIRLALVQQGAKVNVHTQDGWTPLLVAIQHDEIRLVAALLDKGAGIKPKDNGGENVLSCTSPGSAVFNLLLERGADADAATPEGYTALIEAINDDNLSAVKRLIAKGVDVNRICLVMDAHTPLMVAAEDGKAALVNELLKAGADVQAKDKEGRTALRLAEAEWASTRKDEVQMEGMMMHTFCNGHFYAIHRTLSHKHQEVIRLLKQSGAKSVPHHV
jgi:ankyrin repeat protein